MNFSNRTRILENADDAFSTLTMLNSQIFIYVPWSRDKLLRSSNGGNDWSTIDSIGSWDTHSVVKGSTVWGSKDFGSNIIFYYPLITD